MKNYRFRLDTSSKKYSCPQCGQERFVRYVDSVTAKLMPPEYGRCDREQRCGYHLKPIREALQSSHGFETVLEVRTEKQLTEQISYISPDLVGKSLVADADNNFIFYLQNIFPIDTVQRLIERYHIGTSEYWSGSTIFWQIDQFGRARSGKVMLYDPETGHRVKHPLNHVTWIHSILKLKSFKLKQCFFGEHLLKLRPVAPVAITESEKSAILASAYMPEYVWIATGAKNGLSDDKCQVLSGRKVLLYPDLGAWNDWRIKAELIKHQVPNISIGVIDLLEKRANLDEKQQGLDIADFLTRSRFFETICFESRKRNPWTGSSYRTVVLPEGFEEIWEGLKTAKGYKTRLIERRSIYQNGSSHYAA